MDPSETQLLQERGFHFGDLVQSQPREEKRSLLKQHMEAVNIQFAPATGTEEEWNEAYARLADYFRSYRLHNRIRRTQLILETLRRAAFAHAKNPSRTPTAHAIEQAKHMLHEWLGAIYTDLNLTESQIEAAGRLGFHLADGPDRWPHFSSIAATFRRT